MSIPAPADRLSTPLFAPVPSIMVVELEDPVRVWCRAVAPSVTVLWVAHSLAARERALVTRPLVIVIPDHDREALDLADVAASTGAELIRFSETSGRDYFIGRLRDAIVDAEKRRRTPVE